MPLDLLATRHQLTEQLAAAKAVVADLEGEVAAYDRVIAREGLVGPAPMPAPAPAQDAPVAATAPPRIDVTRLGAAVLHPFILAALASRGALASCDLMAAFAQEYGLTAEEENTRKFRSDFAKAISRLVEKRHIANREQQGKHLLRAITPEGREWLREGHRAGPVSRGRSMRAEAASAGAPSVGSCGLPHPWEGRHLAGQKPRQC